MPAIWQDLELGAPDIARLGMTQPNSAGVALLGTLRRDGSPRISPIEPYLAEGQLLLGAMGRSGKAADLLRDPRCILHSTVTGADNGEGELKLYGSAVEAGEHLRGVTADVWWSAWPPNKAIVFSLHIEQAVLRARLHHGQQSREVNRPSRHGASWHGRAWVGSTDRRKSQSRLT